MPRRTYLNGWGDPQERGFPIRLGSELNKYAAYGGRPLDGICLVVDDSDKSRPRCRFTRQQGDPTQPIDSTLECGPNRPRLPPWSGPGTGNANGANDANVFNPGYI